MSTSFMKKNKSLRQMLKKRPNELIFEVHLKPNPFKNRKR